MIVKIRVLFHDLGAALLSSLLPAQHSQGQLRFVAGGLAHIQANIFLIVKFGGVVTAFVDSARFLLPTIRLRPVK